MSNNNKVVIGYWILRTLCQTNTTVLILIIEYVEYGSKVIQFNLHNVAFTLLLFI